MNLKIGENINRLRKEQDITQERLSEYLNISHQAISKWESGNTLPDVALLPKIASILGVTLDVLFGIDNKPPTKVINEISQKVNLLCIGNQLKEAEELLRDGLEQYPRSYELMIKLATTLRNRYKEMDIKEDSLLWESIAKCNTVLRECNNDELRYKARRGLAISYCMCGEQDKAIEMANSIPVTDDIMIYILSGDERIKRCQQNIFTSVEKITSRIMHLAELSRMKGSCEDALYYLNLANNMIDLVFESKDYHSLVDAKSQINYDCAKVYATLKHYDKCIEYLKKYVQLILNIKESSQKKKYTSRVFNLLDCDSSLDSYKNAMKNQAKVILNDSIFEPIRERTEFIELYNMISI